MAKSRTSSSRRPVKKGGKFFPALCNIIGTLILITVIATSIPLAIPSLLGYEAFNVESGSMEPALPVGSVIYVEHIEPEKAQTGDIIVFFNDGAVITHRVVENHYFFDEIITKGDANEINDINPVKYKDVIGRVKYHIPYLGNYLMIYSNPVTKIYLLVLAFCGVMFNILAGQLRRRAEEKFRIELEKWERRQAAKRREEMEAIRKQRM